MSDEIRTLTAAIASGDTEAFSRLYRERFDDCLAEARRATGRDESFCLDVVQDAMMRVIRSMKPLETADDLRRWLNRVVRSCAYDLLRRERRARLRELHRGQPVMDIEPLQDLDERLAWRQRIHEELIAAMTKLHRRRHVRRRTLVAAVLLLPLLFGALVLMKPSAAPPAIPTIVEGEPRLPHPQPGDARPSLVQVVHTDPSVIDRYAYSDSDSTVTWIDDQQLLQELAALGRPAGIVRMNGRAWLTMDVTDDAQDEREEVHTPSSSIVPSPDSAEPRRSAAGRQAATAPQQI